jgi:hypothetical protein
MLGLTTAFWYFRVNCSDHPGYIVAALIIVDTHALGSYITTISQTYLLSSLEIARITYPDASKPIVWAKRRWPCLRYLVTQHDAGQLYLALIEPPKRDSEVETISRLNVTHCRKSATYSEKKKTTGTYLDY